MAQSSANAAGPDLAPSELRYLVLAAQREGNRYLNRQLAALNLTASQSEIILVLHEFGPLTLRELGELIVCETGSPSRIVDTLVKREYIIRTVDESDRRAIVLELSDQGKQFVPHLIELDHAINAAAIEQLTTAQISGLVSSLRTYLTHTVSGEVLDRRFAAKRKPIDHAWGDVAEATLARADHTGDGPAQRPEEAEAVSDGALKGLSPEMLDALADLVAAKITAQR